MKILYMAPVANFESKDGGYGTGSSSILYVLNRMLKEKRIDDLVVLNTTKSIDVSLTTGKQFDVGIVVGNPNSFSNKQVVDSFKYILQGCKKKYFVVLWETMPLPKKWDFLWNNDLFDVFLAPSYFVGVQLSRVTSKPVYYQPYYFNVTEKNKIDIEKKQKENKFTVLWMGQNTVRKGVNEAVVSFSRAFDNVNDVQMVMKYHDLSQLETNIESTIKELALINQSCKNARIYTLNKQLTPLDISNLYKSSSILLFPSRGEGFGLPIGEAMSVGLPVIYTDWSSSSEVGESPCNYPLKYSIDEAVSMYQYGYEIGLKYSFPNISDTIKALHFYYNKWKEDKIKYYELTRKNIDIIKDRFGYEVTSDCLEHAFKEKEGFAPSTVFDIKHWDRNMNQYNNIIKGEL